MRVCGQKENVEQFVKIIKNGDTRRLSRVFDAYVDESLKLPNGWVRASVSGTCAWSVYSCMWEGEHTYFDQSKDPTRTSLIIESREKELDIEVYSEESGLGFEEHYRVKNGEILENEERNIGGFGSWPFASDLLTEYFKEAVAT